MKKLYCGGAFPFDYQNAGYWEQVAGDYRARILGSSDLLLQCSNGILLRNDLMYIGPFYFEAPEMLDSDIVRAEQQMVEGCTHAIFLLEDGCCPGTITELTYASTQNKEIAVFYIYRSDAEETESSLHSPCWYPILFSKLMNAHTSVFPCCSREEAVEKILEYIKTI